MLTTHREVKNKNDIKWEEKFNLLKEYLEEYGKLPPTGYTIYKGVDIGHWCSKQRHLFKGKSKRTLTSDRIAKLNSINFVWDVNIAYWDSVFELLKEYLEEFGEFPKQDTIYKGVRIGAWCNDQRQKYKNNHKRGNLTEYKINKLDSINFVWDIADNSWNTYFELVKEYKEKYGKIKKDTIYKGYNIGSWCDRQRQVFKGNQKGNLTEDRINKLNSIGFEWNLR